jgi:hypothetical protein
MVMGWIIPSSMTALLLRCFVALDAIQSLKKLNLSM